MAHYETEEEQIEAIKDWWKENGRAVIAGVVLAVIGLLGWHEWTAYHKQQADAASDQYQTLDNAFKAGKAAPAIQAGEVLEKNYGGTAFAVLAALRLGSHFNEAGDLNKAATQLRWAVDHASSNALKSLARLRLSRVLLAQKKYDDALALLKQSEEGPYASQFAELRGDTYAAKGNAAQARTAYQEALADQGLSPQRRHLIQIKRNELGGASA